MFCGSHRCYSRTLSHALHWVVLGEPQEGDGGMKAAEGGASCCREAGGVPRNLPEGGSGLQKEALSRLQAC